MWDHAENGWLELLHKLQAARSELYCSIGGAWFRGHSDSDRYALQPSLFREGSSIDSDSAALIDKHNKRIKTALARQISLKKKKTSLLTFDKDSKDISNKVASLSNSIKKERNKLTYLRDQVKMLTLLWNGERQAFIDYGFRSGSEIINSWQILAEMQHHGIPTRMLDWTENILIALYFALSRYRIILEDYWQDSGSLTAEYQQKNYGMPNFFVPDNLPAPSIWVLNPYNASAVTTKRTRIWDLSYHRELDYFNNFIKNQTWPFEGAIPAYSPWRNSRIAAQQGMFMVFGHRAETLNDQIGYKRIKEIRISKLAAVYAVWFLKYVANIDHFFMFRDNDSLAKKITSQFIK